VRHFLGEERFYDYRFKRLMLFSVFAWVLSLRRTEFFITPFPIFTTTFTICVVLEMSICQKAGRLLIVF